MEEVLTEFDDSIGVRLTSSVRKGCSELSRVLLVVVGGRDGTLNVPDGVLKLEKDNTTHSDISGVLEVEREVERSLACRIRDDPILLVFSVRNLTVGDCCIVAHLQKSSSNGRSDEVSLEFCKLGSDLINLNLTLSSHCFVALSNSLLLFLGHGSLHLLGLGQIRRGDDESHVPVGYPLVLGAHMLCVLLLEHFHTAVLHDDFRVVALELEPDFLVFRVACNCVDCVIKVERLLSELKLLLKVLTERLFDNGIDWVDVHLVCLSVCQEFS